MSNVATYIAHNRTDASRSVLSTLRLPARLNANQTAELIGCQPHDIPILIKAGLLKPLGSGPANRAKYFASLHILAATSETRWLEKATTTLCRRASKRDKLSIGERSVERDSSSADL